MTHFVARSVLGLGLLVMVIAGVGVFLLAQVVQRIKLAREVTENENPALAIRYALFLLAVVIALARVVQPADTVRDSLLNVLKYGPAALAVLVVAYFINAELMLHTIENNDAVVQDKNAAVALVEGSTYIATAFITSATLVGLETNVAESLIWLLIGQVALVVLTFLYHRIVPETYEALKRGNIACAMSLGCLLVALGLMLDAAISGPSTTWWKDLGGTGLYLAGWAALMAAAHLFANLLLLGRVRLRAEVMERNNLAAGLLEGAAFISATLMYTLAIR